MEILSQQDLMMIAPSYGKVIIGFGIACLLSAVMSFIFYDFSEVVSYTALGTFIVSGIMVLLLLVFSPRADTGRNRYEVKLDETIDINEFYDKYEVIERRDKIWVIEDREVKDDANS